MGKINHLNSGQVGEVGRQGSSEEHPYRVRRLVAVLGLGAFAAATAVAVDSVVGGDSGGERPARLPAAVAEHSHFSEELGACVYTVQEGDTVWGLAREFEDDEDIRVRVDEFSTQLDTVYLQPGDEIVVAVTC